ncbi:MAG: DNA cytosine methyltransferase [Methanoregula sp.]|nr:MAG: DNA cytosine methyltransferase [Methanoregula sp.]
MADLKNGILDIFCGAGGLSLGFLYEGFDIVYSSDIDSQSIETISCNHKKIQSARGQENYHYSEVEDIRHLDAEKVKRIFRERGYRVQGIIGGPPCQGFSNANKQTRFIDNPNNSLFKEYLRLIKGLDPDFIVFENVVGFLSMGKGKIKEEIISALSDLGYTAKDKVIDSAWCRVPQHRRRVFIVGIKPEKAKDEYRDKISFPGKTKKDFITVKQAISDLPIIGMGEKRAIQRYAKKSSINDYTKQMRAASNLNIKSSAVLNHVTTQSNDLVLQRYKHIPQGGNWQDLPDYLLKNYADKFRCHSYIYRRLEDNKPSITVSNFRKCMFIHPTQNRGLSIREAARLQSFPDWYEFKGSMHGSQQQVACAVPPLMAKSVAQKIKKMLK